LASKRGFLKNIKRVVIKVGSGVITGRNGLNTRVINNLASEISDLKIQGKEVILVSSGAISAGMRKTGFAKRPSSISYQQALAAVGQSTLMNSYERAFGRTNQKVAQILVTRDDLNHRGRYLNARNTIFTLLSWDVIPIINENDTVVVDEIKFGDNDNLSAMITDLTEAQLLINLTDIDGLYDKDPRRHSDARMIHLVERVDRKIMQFASNIPGFLGTGGMASKIMAAKKVNLGGTPVIIANGKKKGVLTRIFNGDREGTLFLPEQEPICTRKRWIAFTRSIRGEIVVDKGAEIAILKNGKSLLPSGIKEINGRFSMGDSVSILNEDGVRLAIGMTNYNSSEVQKIKGLKSYMIEEVLGYKHDDEVIHRDNLVIVRDMEGGDEICQ
jgi:glutamate 5-kinase